MYEAQTFIVRVYRRPGTARRTLVGVVELVTERRIVAFHGLHALNAILANSVAGRPSRQRPKESER